MVEPNRLLVVTHPILGRVSATDVERAVPSQRRREGWDMLVIDPIRATLGDLDRLDWAAAVAEQDRLFDERLRAEMQRRSRLAYFGFAPIPLAAHLGYRVERTRPIDVYQRHHHREDWRWSKASPGAPRPRLLPLSLPERGSDGTGSLVIRVSTLHRVDPGLTAEVVPHPLAQADVALVEPGEDALATQEIFGQVVEGFHRAIAHLNRLFPNATDTHLFMAVPVGLAFRIGTQINPTIYPPVVTYQFQAKARPRYRAAVLLADGLTLASGPSTAPPTTTEILTFHEMLMIWETASQAGLAEQRDALLVGVDRRVIASLRTDSRPSAQLLMDLAALMQIGRARDGSIPLVRWLEVAVRLAGRLREAPLLEAVLGDVLARAC